MIHKVNAPPKMILINSSKNAKNESGASTGGELLDQHDENTEKKRDHQDSTNPRLSLISNLDLPCMSEVIRNHLEFHPLQASGARPGLSLRYLSSHGKTKGLLLNKKV